MKNDDLGHSKVHPTPGKLRRGRWWESARFIGNFLGSSQFRQTSLVPFRLVVDWRSRVETD
jgi:hypothetical protein